jgi:pullulanase/glycogen debranching enzyme
VRGPSGTSPARTRGASAPLGATVSRSGVNFSVFSRHATGIELALFDGVDDGRPTRVVRLDPTLNRTYHYWHTFVPGVRTGQLYGYRVDGPCEPARGLRFDVSKVLLDPYARAVAVPAQYSREAAGKPGDNAATAMKSVVVDPRAYDWEGDAHWVDEMHVDGFRFDLASILARDPSGHVLASPPVLWDIESDPTLAGIKIMAEAWDAAGLYQVGSFVGDSWREWNGRFRDDVRGFLRGEEGAVGRFADRILGSPEIFGHEEREPEQSVNFVTCHDGFTLNDLVSYDRKHNEANGEHNRDGSDDNRSWNCGVEGPTDDPVVERLRNRQVKNFLTSPSCRWGSP